MAQSKPLVLSNQALDKISYVISQNPIQNKNVKPLLQNEVWKFKMLRAKCETGCSSVQEALCGQADGVVPARIHARLPCLSIQVGMLTTLPRQSDCPSQGGRRFSSAGRLEGMGRGKSKGKRRPYLREPSLATGEADRHQLQTQSSFAQMACVSLRTLLQQGYPGKRNI